MAPDTPKGASSRLLTMKFMQRAIASNSAPASPESEPGSAKKRKLEHGSPASRLSMNFDQASVDAAVQAREAARHAALQQHATGDTHWVLKTKFEKPTTVKPAKVARKIVYVGYGDIDSDNDDGDGADVAANGRTSSKPKPKPKTERSQNPSDDESGDDSGDDSDDSEDSNPRKRKQPGSQQNQSRSRSRSRNAADPRAKDLRDKRRKKDVRSNNNITSISGSSDKAAKSKSMTCYNCHQSGHKSSDCPRRKPGGRSK
ncbi:Zinc finger domain-containing protein, CCHC-type [Cordyceps fumosorosea ARSEF 2679]|uniref:Zinc finger domain-containing protein, CCHC-type n=1 Tax=Cordyceps fumosorosea (strain ARSEF 2679) TaxID=1081104 RepID=A0A168ERA1_CORFA|nr:Zinc finger domain-containing protein, CCHC-type [Cordyceps fumosorosea ARSEF 2679]OAA74118.1 Zinc finger domain-containing protein, CCHC-type [Cordyceps fumosorosea ARSEF 2679]